jgi:hypothetical protein
MYCAAHRPRDRLSTSAFAVIENIEPTLVFGRIVADLLTLPPIIFEIGTLDRPRQWVGTGSPHEILVIFVRPPGQGVDGGNDGARKAILPEAIKCPAATFLDNIVEVGDGLFVVATYGLRHTPAVVEKRIASFVALPAVRFGGDCNGLVKMAHFDRCPSRASLALFVFLYP